ncbi:unnamed protein product [Spirodela intermedia]|uniref:Tf2-1-like SH3-like domain-containing protein n=1 Tax=Spirodela intermedia TaxID=51605 RepID=A0A7I8LDT6_SPIIN|nr:unnamed protein product [Spirodela intermedia]
MTPFGTVYGRDPLQLIKHGIYPSPLDAIDQLLTEQDAILKILKFNLHKAQVRMKFNINNHRREVELEVGDLENEKLNPRYFGPYLIIERIGLVAYKLQLFDHSAVHLVRSLKTEILVSWKNLPEFESSWMIVSTFL